MKLPLERDDRFSRRALLRRAGLGAALVPLLDARRGWGTPAPPRRLVVLQWTNGVIDSAYWPTGTEHSFTLPESLKPLEPFKRDIIVVGGVGLTVMKDSTVPKPGGGHQSTWALLTGAPAAAGPNGNGIANGISVDQYVANAIAARSPLKLRSLELGAVVVPAADQGPISYRGPAAGGRPASNPPEINPYTVWNRLFKDLPALPGSGMPGMDEEFFRRLRAKRKSVLDFLRGELRALEGQVGARDAQKIEQHLTALRQLEVELTSLAAPGAGCAPKALPPDLPWSKVGNKVDVIVRVQMDLLLMALRCDLTRVATLMMCNGANDSIYFPFLGSEFPASGPNYQTNDHHGISHAAGNSATTENGRKKVIIDRWWVQQYAYLLEQLRQTPEGSGTMLDNTLVVLVNNMSNGAGHGIGAGIPFILAGSCQGYFKTGRWVARHARSTPHNQVLVAIANAMLHGTQAPLAHFGDPKYGGELPGLRG